jgi:hypothetical protein
MKLIIPSLFFFYCFSAIGQVNGDFKCEFDNNGNKIVYFEGQNITNMALWNVKIDCVNSSKGDKLSFLLNQLNSGDSFYIGPNEGWNWELGEKLYITYSNGQTFYWTYENTMNTPNDESITIPNDQSPSIQYNETSKQLRIQQIDLQINQLESRIKDTERSLKLYEDIGAKNPSAANTMLQQSTRRLIQKYEQQKYNLELEKSKLQN